MKVIETAKTPDDINIQLEEWGDNENHKYTIGAYPVAKRNSKYNWIVAGKIFRITISENVYRNYTNEMVLSDYEDLKSGKKRLEDLADYYWNGDKDKWRMGLLEERPDDY